MSWTPAYPSSEGITANNALHPHAFDAVNQYVASMAGRNRNQQFNPLAQALANNLALNAAIMKQQGKSGAPSDLFSPAPEPTTGYHSNSDAVIPKVTIVQATPPAAHSAYSEAPISGISKSGASHNLSSSPRQPNARVPSLFSKDFSSPTGPKGRASDRSRQPAVSGLYESPENAEYSPAQKLLRQMYATGSSGKDSYISGSNSKDSKGSRFSAGPDHMPSAASRAAAASLWSLAVDPGTVIDPLQTLKDISAPFLQASGFRAITLMNIFHMTINTLTNHEVQNVTEQMLDRFQLHNPAFRYSQEIIDVGQNTTVRLWILNFSGTQIKGVGKSTSDALTEAMFRVVDEIEKYPELLAVQNRQTLQQQGTPTRQMPVVTRSAVHGGEAYDPAAPLPVETKDILSGDSKADILRAFELLRQRRENLGPSAGVSSSAPTASYLNVLQSQQQASRSSIAYLFEKHSKNTGNAVTTADLLSRVRAIMHRPAASSNLQDVTRKQRMSRDDAIVSDLKSILKNVDQLAGATEPLQRKHDESPSGLAEELLSPSEREVFKKFKALIERPGQSIEMKYAQSSRERRASRDRGRSRSREGRSRSRNRRSRSRHDRRKDNRRDRDQKKRRSRSRSGPEGRKRSRGAAHRERSEGRSKRSDVFSRAPEIPPGGVKREEPKKIQINLAFKGSKVGDSGVSHHERKDAAADIRDRSIVETGDSYKARLGSEERELLESLKKSVEPNVLDAVSLTKTLTTASIDNDFVKSGFYDVERNLRKASEARERGERRAASRRSDRERTGSRAESNHRGGSGSRGQDINEYKYRDGITKHPLDGLDDGIASRDHRDFVLSSRQDLAKIDYDRYARDPVLREPPSRLVTRYPGDASLSDFYRPLPAEHAPVPLMDFRPPVDQPPLIDSDIRVQFNPRSARRKVVVEDDYDGRSGDNYVRTGRDRGAVSSEEGTRHLSRDRDRGTRVVNLRGTKRRADEDVTLRDLSAWNAPSLLGIEDIRGDKPTPLIDVDTTQSLSPKQPKKSVFLRLGSAIQPPGRQGEKGAPEKPETKTKLQALFVRQIREHVNWQDTKGVMEQVDHFLSAYSPDFVLENMHDVKTKERISIIRIDGTEFEGRGKDRPTAVFSAAKQFLYL